MQMQSECRYGARCPGTPMNDGMPPRARMSSVGDASSSRVVTPGRMAAPTASSTSATSRPATAMRSIWLALLSVTRRSPKRHRQARFAARSATRSRSARDLVHGPVAPDGVSTPVSA